MQRPYACGNTAEDERFGVYVVSKREEYLDAFRQASGILSKIGRQTFLCMRVLCYVSTVGNVKEETILKYIQKQEENDKLENGRK